MAPNRHPHRSKIPWTLLLPNNKAARDATRAITRRNRRRGEHSLPLPHHVIGLVRRHRRPIGDVRARGQIRADQAHGDLVRETEHGEARDEREAVEHNNRPAELESVAHVRGQQRGDDGVVVRRGGEQDRLPGVEAHAALQDDGEEVAHTRRHEVLQEVQGAEAVDLDVFGVHKHLAPGEGIDLVVAAVVGDAGAGDTRLGLAQEVERRVRTFWEVGHPPVGQDT